MTTFYFIGGEDSDFTKIGVTTVDTSTNMRRTANARCALRIGPGQVAGDGWVGTLSAPQSSLWFTGRFFNSSSQPSTSAAEILQFRDSSGTKRLALHNNNSTLTLSKVSAAGAYTQLATSSFLPGNGITYKVDVSINYSASGSFQLYADGSPILSYTGNMVTDSATSIASFMLAAWNSNNNGSAWSEIICADVDTRSMGLTTLAPTANGNTFNFDAGNYASVNETILDDSTVITSGTVGQVAQFTVGSSGVSGAPAIRAVCVAARAGKGSTGPQSAKIGVRTGGADYVSGSIALQSGSLGRIQNIFVTNPATGNAWAASELTAAGFNVGIVSDT
ncbi:MAG: hypothetical protein ACXWIU_10445 [Limisphaerales bacterium]